jgi:hypothetical protein
VTGGYDAIRQLGTGWNFLSVEEDRQIAVMSRHGDLLGAQKLALSALELKFGGSYQRLRDLGAGPPSGAMAALASHPGCNTNSTENMRDFGSVLRELRVGSAGTVAELQKVVVNLCASGKPEREAFAEVMAILRGAPIEGAK